MLYRDAVPKLIFVVVSYVNLIANQTALIGGPLWCSSMAFLRPLSRIKKILVPRWQKKFPAKIRGFFKMLSWILCDWSRSPASHKQFPYKLSNPWEPGKFKLIYSVLQWMILFQAYYGAYYSEYLNSIQGVNASSSTGNGTLDADYEKTSLMAAAAAAQADLDRKSSCNIM